MSELKKYLELCAQVESECHMPQGFKYGRAGFILANGRNFTFPDFSSFQGKPKGQGQCYKNAGLVALGGKETYVEGYVSVYGVPIAHAWLVNVAGVVRDVTLQDGKNVKEYFGVPFKTEFLREHLLKTKVWGVFGHMTPKELLTGNPADFVEIL